MIGVPAAEKTHELDLAAIGKAITARTRAILINSPINPTGKIYSEESLRALGELLVKGAGVNMDQPL